MEKAISSQGIKPVTLASDSSGFIFTDKSCTLVYWPSGEMYALVP